MRGKKDERGSGPATPHRLSSAQRAALARSAGRGLRRSRQLLVASLVLLADCRRRRRAGTEPAVVHPRSDPPQSADDQRSAILTAVAICGIELPDLWLCYANLGGDRSRRQLLAFLDGTDGWPTNDCDMLSHALNETLWTKGIPSFLEYSGGPAGPRS